MSAQCPIHDEPMSERDGQYGPFWSHRTTDATYPKGWCNGKPPKGESFPAMQVREPIPQPAARDFDKEARGKTRCQVFCSVVERDGIEAALSQLSKIELGVSYIMTGPAKPEVTIVKLENEDSEEDDGLPY